MLKVSQMEKVVVYKPKKGQTGDPEKLDRSQLSSIGKIHLTVCSPSGKRVVGFLIKRPDIAGMVKQKDVFIALDSFAVCDWGLVATRGEESFDDAARERLHLPWEKCIIWAGMDAKTTNGRELGWVADFSFDGKSGKISTFYVGDGGVASSLVGYIEIPANMLRGYQDGWMLVDPDAAKLELDGGLAAKAGEGYARAKVEGKAAGKKAAKVAGTAVEKGAYGLGRLIGKAKRSIEDYQREDDEEEADASKEPVEVESISEPATPELIEEGESVGETAADGTSQPEKPRLRTFVAVSEAQGPVDDAGTSDDEKLEATGQETPGAQGTAGSSASQPDGSVAEQKQTTESSPAEKTEPQPKTQSKDSTSAKAEQPTAAKKASASTESSKSGSKAKSTKPKAKSKSVGDQAARAFGRGLGKMNSMFGSFVDEYKKASK